MNTVLLVEPRILEEIPDIILEYYKYLPEWKFVFYCGKGTKSYWETKLDSYVELRELEVNNFSLASEYSFFMKQKILWESLYGDYVLTIQADSMIMSLEPYNINYFMNLNKSYIGGNMNYMWRELEYHNITFRNYNFNGGLSLRKRKDMIKVIETFPPKMFNERENDFSIDIETHPEDIYFTVGCYKLGLPIGDDDECSHFSVHCIFKNAFFGIHKPAGGLSKEGLVRYFPTLQKIHI